MIDHTRRIDQLIDEFVPEQICSASLCVLVEGIEHLFRSAGYPSRHQFQLITEDQPYDLASLTKAIAGTTVTAALIERGKLRMEDEVSRWFPDVDSRITLAHLLTHSSGYPAWRPLYLEVNAFGTLAAKQRICDLARQTPLEVKPGSQEIYSDIGFLVLLQLLETVGEQTFEEMFEKYILGPSGEHELKWGWPGAAATEDCSFRKCIVEGSVHDLNAAALGGISTHAGLFGTARGVARFCERLRRAVIAPKDFRDLPGKSLKKLWEWTGPGSHRGGFDGISSGNSSTGHAFPADTIGHLGYTGTSMWIAPSRRTVVVLLTNRIHPLDDRTAIRRFRPMFHDAIAMSLGWT